MTFLLNHPIALFGLTLALLWGASYLGTYFRHFNRESSNLDEADFSLILGATLTLLGLIIGFTFSMAVSHYDQRKNYEEEEANAIGTEYARAGLLPAADAVKVRTMLTDYLDQRILNYKSRDSQQLRQIDVQTTRLQTEVWAVVAK